MLNRHTVLLLKPEASLWLSLVDGCSLCVWFIRYGKFEAGNKLSYTEFQVPPTDCPCKLRGEAGSAVLPTAAFTLQPMGPYLWLMTACGGGGCRRRCSVTA